MAALIGMDHCNYLLMDFARHFNRNMSSMSKMVQVTTDPPHKKSVNEGENSVYQKPNNDNKRSLTPHLGGGSAWESNPPNEVLARYTGFEVREPHQ